ncbi:MAG: hypothetical protein P1U42_12725 [Phycisphaerales bacterium]|nr:hypothetical protein [Phycisphaerales bacterium]
MQITLITTKLVFAAVSAIFIAGCTSSSPRACESKSCSTNQSLSRDKVANLLHTDQGRQELARFAQESNLAFYDGDDRFIQITPMISFDHSEPLVGMEVHSGLFADPQYAVSYVIRLLNTNMEDRFNVDFEGDQVSVNVNEYEPFVFNWPSKFPLPFGQHNFATGESMMNQ